ncbi:hypothetical protein TNIN_366551 [Trichonephila inaurata madagascariensis]|uniref:Uncharacterized protein n=1 Tax=Trichonephila inaurata madagascariensis TaxID=2747483 RepID=A0A8X6MFR2_9ARAC|nr:hypothetical protein TNIN_366551 [Trichonephila inaurata madagascariensis]
MTEEEEEECPKGFKKMFLLYCKTTKAKENKLHIDIVKKWLLRSGVIGTETGITHPDVGEAFSTAPVELEFERLKTCLIQLAKDKFLDPKGIMEKLAHSSPPKPGEEDPEDGEKSS